MPLYSPPIHGKLMWPHRRLFWEPLHYQFEAPSHSFPVAFWENIGESGRKSIANIDTGHIIFGFLLLIMEKSSEKSSEKSWMIFRTPWRSEVRLALCAQWIFQSIPQKVLQQRREIFADLIERSGASRSENAQWSNAALLTSRRTFSFLKTWKKSWPWIANPCRNWKHVALQGLSHRKPLWSPWVLSRRAFKWQGRILPSPVLV